MSEPTVDAGTRGAILEALAAKSKSKAKEAPKQVSNLDEVDEKTTFNELLERSLAKRDEVNEDEAKAADDLRKRAINESQVGMVGDIMKRML